MISVPGIDLQYYFEKSSAFVAENFPFFVAGLKSFIGILIGISIPLSILLILGIVICVEGLKKIRAKEEEKYNTKVEPAFTDGSVQVGGEVGKQGDEEMTVRWRKVMEHLDSTNENDWRQAIIESDIMLEDLLVKLGYRGDGIGERLRRVEKGDFKTLEQAGEAHGIRNRIAHDGSGFALNQIEARRVIGLYRQVFEEFYHVSG